MYKSQPIRPGYLLLLMLCLFPFREAPAQEASGLLHQYHLFEHYNALALAGKQTADYARAQACYEEGLDSLTAPRYRFLLANNFAELLLRRGMYATAQQVIDEFAGMTDPRIVAARDMRQADICIYTGEYDRADSLYAAIAPDDADTRAAIAANRAFIAMERGRYAAALTLFAEAESHGADNRTAHLILANKATAQAHLGRYTEALRNLDRCIAYFSEDSQDHTICLRKRAEVMLMMNRKKDAAKAFQAYFLREKAYAIRQFADFNEQQRIDYWNNKHPLIGEAFALEDACPDFLFDVALFRREVALLGTANASQMESRLRTTGKEVRRAMKPNETAVEFVRYEKDGISCYGALIVPPAATGNRRRVRFCPLWTEEALNSFPIQDGELKDAICSSRPEDKDAIYSDSALARFIWQPLKPYIPRNAEIYFAPDGLLNLLAIEYLPYDGPGWAGLHRLTTTARLLRRTTPANGQGGTTLVLGGLDYDAMPDPTAGTANHEAMALLMQYTDNAESIFTPLFGTRIEADAIGTLAARADTRHTMTEEQIKAALATGSISALHLSTHGYALHVDVAPVPTHLRDSISEDRSLWASGIALTGANVAYRDERCEDGILSARELCDLDLRGLRLVVLSACQSALGKVSDEGPAGLIRGLKKAGAGTIVASLWEVDDLSAATLMADFYRTLREHPEQGMTAALAEARRRLREPAAEADTAATPGGYRFDAATLSRQRHNGRPTKHRRSSGIPGNDAPRHWAAFIIVDDI